MISIRLFLIFISSVLVAMGIGIILGGAGGQAWIDQQEQNLVEHLEARMEQITLEKEQLKQALHKKETVLQNLKGQNQSLIQEVVQGELTGRQVLLLGKAEADSLKRMIQWAGGTVVQRETLPASAEHFDAIVLLFHPNEQHSRWKAFIHDIQSTYSGPLILPESQKLRPVFEPLERRSYFFSGKAMKEPLKMVELIHFIQNAINHYGNEAAS